VAYRQDFSYLWMCILANNARECHSL